MNTKTLTRRDFLLLAAVAATGCGRAAEGTAAEGTAGPGPRTAPGSGGPAPGLAVPGAGLPPGTPWRAGAGEIKPEVKELASRLVETAGSWSAGANDTAALRTRLSAAGFPPALAGSTGALLSEAPAARTQVTYPQYGGLGSGRASVMVTAEQTLVAAAGPARRGFTVDVRLVETGVGWAVQEALPGIPGPEALPLDAAATAVLRDRRIALPAAAAGDIRAGVVDPQVLAMLTALAAEHELAVAVLVSGHPRNVFGTDRVSKHTLGRAVDIWRIDGHPLADPATPPELVSAVMRHAAALGAVEIGGPVDLDGGPGGAYFTDDVHHDHVHFGVRGS